MSPDLVLKCFLKLNLGLKKKINEKKFRFVFHLPGVKRKAMKIKSMFQRKIILANF